MKKAPKVTVDNLGFFDGWACLGRFHSIKKQ